MFPLNKFKSLVSEELLLGRLPRRKRQNKSWMVHGHLGQNQNSRQVFSILQSLICRVLVKQENNQFWFSRFEYFGQLHSQYHLKFYESSQKYPNYKIKWDNSNLSMVVYSCNDEILSIIIVNLHLNMNDFDISHVRFLKRTLIIIPINKFNLQPWLNILLITCFTQDIIYIYI